MSKSIFVITAVFLISCKTTSYFVVRHAEKAEATMSSDVPLSEAGKQRAEALRELLKKEGISHIYSTNYQRTKSTAQPLATATQQTIETYNPGDTGFVTRVKQLGKGNVLIVGHSNTVDNLVNALMGRNVIPNDLPESQYGDLFIVRKKGKKYSFETKRFGN